MSNQKFQIWCHLGSSEVWYPSCPSVNLIRWPYEPSFLPSPPPFPPISQIFFHFTSLHLSLLFPLLRGNSFILICYSLFLLPLPPLPVPSPHQDHDKTQEEVLKHQASISQLKRSFMEAPPPSPPQLNQWEKRLTSSPATIRIQPQQVVCLSAASKKMHDFSGCLSGICLGICTKTIYFFNGNATEKCVSNSCCVTLVSMMCNCGSVAGQHDGLSPVGIIPTKLSRCLPFLFSSWTNSTF